MARRVRRTARAVAPAIVEKIGNPLQGISGTQRALLSGLLVLLTLASLYALSIYIDEHASSCLQPAPGGPLNVVCYEFDFYPGLRGQPITEFDFESRLVLAPVGLFLAALLFYPLVPRIIDSLRARWQAAYTPLALLAVCLGMGAFVLRFGNRQFGGFDFSILVEHGWRLAQGQIPYRDFVCTLPPGFFLGIKWAFLIFGVRWNAMLWATALFTAGTFLWIFALLRTITEKPLVAFLTAVIVEAAGNLVLSFWWYNNVTNLTVTLFFLSCVLLLKGSASRWPWISYVVSLAAMGMMKPNIAGLTGILGVAVLFAFAGQRIKLAALTATAVAANLLFLTVNHVSIPGLLASYRELARGRTDALLIGLVSPIAAVQIHGYFFLLFLLLPFWIWPQRFRAAVRGQNRASIGYYLLLLAAPAISMIGMLTNGEFKDVEWPIMICGGMILLYTVSGDAAAVTHPWTLRIYACCLCTLLASDLYMGVERFRVRGIGEHAFFEWNESIHMDGIPFFADMQASERFWRLLNQVDSVTKRYPGPIYFGPRLEFAYGVFRIPSPPHLAAWWDPSTAFARDRVPEMEAAWRANHFRTLIFVKHDAIYFRDEFLQEITTNYVTDERWRDLTVLHAKEPARTQ